MFSHCNPNGSQAFGALGAVQECTTAEWERDPDGCEIRNLQEFESRPPDMILTTNTSAAGILSAADLIAAIKAAGGVLNIWSSNVSQNSALKVAAANPLLFKVTAGSERGEYTITLKTGLGATLGSIVTGGASGAVVAGKSSGEPLGGYLPYILGGAGLLIVLSMLKK